VSAECTCWRIDDPEDESAQDEASLPSPLARRRIARVGIAHTERPLRDEFALRIVDRDPQEIGIVKALANQQLVEVDHAIEQSTIRRSAPRRLIGVQCGAHEVAARDHSPNRTQWASRD
jgi:hypothetical protein